MNHWTFVAGAYAIAVVATAALLLWALRGMRRAEVRAEELKRR